MTQQRATASWRRGAQAGVGILTGVAWLASWAWVFAFSYSASYFDYSLCSRVSVFVAAMFGSAMIPAGAFLLWRRLESLSGIVIGQVGVSLVSLFPLGLTSFLLSRVRGTCHLSGDDAMGAGIDFLLLSGTAAASVGVMAMAAVWRRARTRRDASGRGVRE